MGSLEPSDEVREYQQRHEESRADVLNRLHAVLEDTLDLLPETQAEVSRVMLTYGLVLYDHCGLGD